MPALIVFFAALLLFSGQALAKSSPQVLLSEDTDKLQLVVQTGNLKSVAPKNVQKAAVKSQGAAFNISPKGARTWTSSWRQKPTLLEGLYGKEVAVIFKKKRVSKWLVFKARLAEKPTEDPEDPTEDPTEDPIAAGVSATGLTPAWSESISDYTVLCDSPVSLSVNIPGEVSVSGGAGQTAVFKKELSLKEGQAFTLEGTFGKQYFRCRPKDLPLPSVSGQGTGSFYLVAPTLFGSAPLTNYAIVLDKNGVPVWWYKAPNPQILDFKMVSPGKFAWVQARNGPGGFSYSDYTLQNLNGEFIDSISTVGFGADHHDLQPTSDGGWLLIGYVPRNCPAVPAECIDLSPWGGPAQATAIDGWVQKIDADGNAEWTWKSQDHIDLAESTDWISSLGSGVTLADGRKGYDIIHINSVEEDGNGFIFSARHLDAVYRVENPAGAGAIDWKLGGTATPQSLTVLDDPLGSDPLGGQHDARVLPDGTVTIHENGTGKSRPPRMVRYEVDPLANTASLISQISDPLVTNSFCCGGGRVLPDGNGWAVSWGANSIVGEYALDGTPRLRMTWPNNKSSYRVVPVSPADLPLASLRAGMDAQAP